MPSTVKVRIVGARNLPSASTDVTVSLGGHSGVVADDHADEEAAAAGDEGLGWYSNLGHGTGADGQHMHMHASDVGTSSAGLGSAAISTVAVDSTGGGGKRKCYSARTRPCRPRSHNPTYDEEFRFEVADDTLLQDEPLIFKVTDRDVEGIGVGRVGAAGSGAGKGARASASDGSIGLVYVDLNPLLASTATEMEPEGGDNNADNGDYDGSGGGGGGGGKDDELDKAGSYEGAADEGKSGRKRRSTSFDLTQVASSLSPAAEKAANAAAAVASSNTLLPSVPHDNSGRPATGGGGLSSGTIDGWFPLYDTLGGVRGELGLSIKLTFIGDENPFRDSSAGVQLFPFSELDPASGYAVSHVFGFVEELVVADDPEFEWVAGQQARTSHETRQTLLYLLDASVRRRMCKKVLEMGGNAVLGYYQAFDIEGDSGIVARTFGTCVLLTRRGQIETQEKEIEMAAHHRRGGSADDRMASSSSMRSKLLRTYSSGRSMRSDEMPDGQRPSPKDQVVSPMVTRGVLSEAAAAAARHMEGSQDEVQLLTLREFDPRVRVRIGGLVTARSVKFLGNLASKLSDQDTRDSWWSELRDEIRSHARTLCCWTVIGYSEASTIHDDVCVLSITGTAATVRGLPDLTQDHRLWLQYEMDQTNPVGTNDRRLRRGGGNESSPGDSMPGSAFGMTPTMYSRGISDDEGEAGDVADDNSVGGRDGDNVDKLPMGQMVVSQPLSKKALKEARRIRHAKRIERRFRKARDKTSDAISGDNLHERPSMVGQSDDAFAPLRARLARPCSYCHVPYHHRLA